MATLPTRVVGTYWQDTNTSNPLSDIHPNVNVIYVAFAKGTSATAGTLVERGIQTGVYSSATMVSAVAAAKAAGKVVILSIGGSDDVIGSTGVNYTLSTSTQITNAVSSLTSLINTYGFDGIDWDLESAYKFTVAAMVSVSNQLKTAFPSLLVTLTPEHFDAVSTSGTYRAVADALGSTLSLFQPQFYNAGVFTSKSVWQNYISTTTAALIARYGQSRVAIGLEIVSGNIASKDSAGFTMTEAEFDNIWDTLIATYPNLRGAFVWSSNADKASSYKFASTVGNHILSTPGGSTPAPTGGSGGLVPNFW